MKKKARFFLKMRVLKRKSRKNLKTIFKNTSEIILYIFYSRLKKKYKIFKKELNVNKI